jgi:hypothetical protein
VIIQANQRFRSNAKQANQRFLSKGENKPTSDFSQIKRLKKQATRQQMQQDNKFKKQGNKCKKNKTTDNKATNESYL